MTMPWLSRKKRYQSWLLALVGIALVCQVFISLHLPSSSHNNLPILVHQQSEGHVLDTPQNEPSSDVSAGAESSKPSLQWDGMNLHYIAYSPPSSLVHCIGDNFLPSAWIYRSCQYRSLCYSSTEGFFVTMSESQKELETLWSQSSRENIKYARFSSTMNPNQTIASVIGTSSDWTRKQKFQWSAKVRTNGFENNNPSGYYQLPSNTVWIPIMATTPKSPMSLLLDTVMPLYNLLSMFGWEKDDKQWLVSILNDGTETKNDNDICDDNCIQLLTEGLRLLGGASRLHVVTTKQIRRQFMTGRICASYGAAGMGMLTDHSLGSKHGNALKDYSQIRNMGRGFFFYNFRSHILQTLNISEATQDGKMQKVTFLLDDTDISKVMEHVKVEQQRILLQQQEQGQDILKHMSLHSTRHSSNALEKESIEQAVSSNVYIASSTDNAWPALFLSRGSTLILLYDETIRTKGGRKQSKHHSVMKNFDFWNHLTHIQVHWLSRQGVLEQFKSQDGIGLILSILRDSLESIAEERETRTESKNGNKKGTADGSFNGMDIHLVQKTTNKTRNYQQTLLSNGIGQLHSRVHCVGENWEWDVENYRSCYMRHLCLNVSKTRPSPFVLSLSPFHHFVNASLSLGHSHIDDAVSTKLIGTKVMVGQSVRMGTGKPFFPDIISMDDLSTIGNGLDHYYELPHNVVWLPYFAEQPNANNPGHLLWDYLLPFYNLLAMFGLTDDAKDKSIPGIQLFLTNLDMWCVNYGPYPCWEITSKFLPLLGIYNSQTLSNTYNPHLILYNDGRDNSTVSSSSSDYELVCARHGVSGIGMLTDHGYKKHGQLLLDYQVVHNVGRGPTLWNFRNFAMRNIERMNDASSIKIDSTSSLHQPYIITFSINSSNNVHRRRDFSKQIALLNSWIQRKQSLWNWFSPRGNEIDNKSGNIEVKIQTVEMGKLSLLEQIQVVTESAIFISVIGGAASTATFMKRNTCLILFYDNIGDFVKGSQTDGHASIAPMPNMMDWDFWNHASYLRLNWLPIKTMDEKQDLEVFLSLVQHELETMSRFLE